MKKFIALFSLLSFSHITMAQDLPYKNIPEYPETFTAGTVAARTIDGLGFRFYWATEGLTVEQYQMKPAEDIRNIEETVTHIYEMSFLVLNVMIENKEQASKELSFEEMRTKTLKNLHRISDILKKSTNEEINEFNIIRSNGTTIPFWNMLNGPILDSVWHCGQIVSFRRMAGNPFNAEVSVFYGRGAK